MGTRTAYAPGTFCWVDLSASDLEAAKSFYSQLFGWRWDDAPAAQGGTYSMASVGDDGLVAGALGLVGPEAEAATSPRWTSYVTVDDLDACLARANELGGRVIAEPYEIEGAGSEAVVADPSGALLGLWRPAEHIGATLVNSPGALTWNELATPDPDRAAAFYEGLFGWAAESMDTGGAPAYLVVSVDGRANGGIREQGADEAAHVPANWMPYFATDSTEDAVVRARALGAMVLLEPMRIPNGGRIAALRDPQGAAFAIWEGDLDD